MRPVLKSSLVDWYGSTTDLQNTDLDFCRRKARSVHAFRRTSAWAPPDSYIRLVTATEEATQDTHLLVGDNLIWIDAENGSRRVRVLNLRSWTSRVFHGEAREKIHTICASDELVVLATQNVAYVARLSGQDVMKKFRVVNPSVLSSVTCRGRTVACAGAVGDSVLVYIWEFDTQQGRSFNINPSNGFFSGRPVEDPDIKLAILLQPNAEVITVFTFVLKYSTKVFYSGFTFGGDCVFSASQTLSSKGAYHPTRTLDCGLGFIPASHDGLFMLQIRWNKLGTRVFEGSLLYDERLNAFTTSGYAVTERMGTHRHTVFWKDVCIISLTGMHLMAHTGSR